MCHQRKGARKYRTANPNCKAKQTSVALKAHVSWLNKGSHMCFMHQFYPVALWDEKCVWNKIYYYVKIIHATIMCEIRYSFSLLDCYTCASLNMYGGNYANNCQRGETKAIQFCFNTCGAAQVGRRIYAEIMLKNATCVECKTSKWALRYWLGRVTCIERSDIQGSRHRGGATSTSCLCNVVCVSRCVI